MQKNIVDYNRGKENRELANNISQAMSVPYSEGFEFRRKLDDRNYESLFDKYGISGNKPDSCMELFIHISNNLSIENIHSLFKDYYLAYNKVWLNYTSDVIPADIPAFWDYQEEKTKNLESLIQWQQRIVLKMRDSYFSHLEADFHAYLFLEEFIIWDIQEKIRDTEVSRIVKQ